MYSRLLRALLLTTALLSLPAAAAAQDIPASCKGWERLAVVSEQVRAGHFRLREKAEITCDTFKFFADHVDVYTDEDRLVATGNVLFTTPDTRISASKVEFDLKAKTGVFYDATGSSKVKPQLGTPTAKSMFGTQEADMHFHGEKLEKLGERKYRLTNGRFTTCLQPTPRWEFTSDSVTINLDRYAVARNAVFLVKGVPLGYLPIIYYPLDDDDRSTGFLLPGYGQSSVRGQTIRNAFFWAINRSSDLTLEHNFFTKAGQSYGGEYRYVAGPASHGTVAASFLNEKAYETVLPNGTPIKRDAGRTTQVRGSLVQDLPGTFRAGAIADYTSNITTRQLYQQNVFDYTNRQSSIRGNVSGALMGWQIGGEFARNQIFNADGGSFITGSSPRVTLSHAEQRVPGLPIYWSVSGEGFGILHENRPAEGDPTDRNRLRVDALPTIRAPLSKLAWLQATSSVAWRTTWWSESLDASGVQIEEPISRNYFEFQTNFVGPVFNRIFDTARSGYAQRWKHVVEPSLSFSRTTGIDKTVSERIVRYDATDTIVGSATRVSYGLTNRLYAKAGEGTTGVVREVAVLSVRQTYYTDPQSALADQTYRNNLTQEQLSSKLSPVAFSLRVSPVDASTVEFAAEYDTQFDAIRQLSATTTLRVRQNFDLSGGWSQQRLIPGLPGFSDPLNNAHYLNAATNLRTANNHYGGTYQFSYDILRSGFLNQRVMAYYNAQCCGIGIEYQTTNRPTFGSGQGQVLDRIFNLSFTLAGIGSFSDFFGAFGLDQRR